MSKGAALNKVKYGAAHVALTQLVGVNQQGNREKDDFYATPPEATEALLRVESFDGGIWEPACGDGAISKVLEAHGYRVASSDLVDRGYGTARIDFLMMHRVPDGEPRLGNIVTNPPFKLAVPFVRKALELTTGKVAMLLKIAFLEGVERAELFANSPLARVHVFKRRVTFANASRGDANGSGMMAFAWFVWDHAHKGKPELGWI